MKRQLLGLLVAAALIAPIALLAARHEAPELDRYVFGVIVGRDDRKPISDEEAKKIQDQHMAHIRDMAESGSLVSAGPTDDPAKQVRGFFIFKAPMDLASRLANTDPTVLNNRNRIELYAWTAPKGIGEPYRKWAAANPGKNPTMTTFPVAFWKEGRVRVATGASAAERHAFMSSLFESGKLISGGPFEGTGSVRGIYVFGCPDDEARKLAAQDPEVLAGHLRLEWLTWYAADNTFK